jgi:hypothetical protein
VKSLDDVGVENDRDVGVKDDCTFLACPTRETENLFTEIEIVDTEKEVMF